MTTDSIPAGTIARPSKALFALALDAQEIDGELSLAMGLLSSEDPDERQQGEEMITALLEAASDANDALVAKSDQMLELAQWLQARAAHLKATAKQRMEAAAREEEAADALVARVAAVLSFRNPGQKSFALPEHRLASRASSSVMIEDESMVPDRFARLEAKVRVPATGEATNHEATLEAMQRQLDELGIPGELVWEKRADKKLILAASKEGVVIPGATVQAKRSWRIA